MSKEIIQKMIKKYGNKSYNGNRITESVAICFVCGERIRMTSDQDMENTEFVLTRSGEPRFIHKACVPQLFGKREGRA